MLDVRCWSKTPREAHPATNIQHPTSKILLILLVAASAFAAPPIKIVLVAGKPSHGPGQHEFNAGTLVLEKCLRQNKGIETVVVKGGWPEDDKVFDGASSIVLYMDGGDKHPLIMGNLL